MSKGLHEELIDIWAAARPEDLLDVLIVATFVYAFLAWSRASRSRWVLLGCGLLGLVYLVARLLRLHLTLSVFQIGFTVALVGLVVIFQEEIRRSFERLARGVRDDSRHLPLAATRVSEILVEVCDHLTKEHIGALIVLPGREPLQRHTTGGVPLDGEVSEPLLYSLFDPNSLGHDGAVIVEGERVSKFGVHLPLSDHVHGREKFGTRHTAALGLCERSDALILVVSEERGDISIAHEGKLSHVDIGELKGRLERFAGDAESQSEIPLLRRLFLRNWGPKTVSFLIALTAWALFFGSQNEIIAKTFTVPILVRNVPPEWMIEDPKPHEARVTLSGTDQALRQLDADRLSISLEVEQPRPGQQQLPVGLRDVTHPEDLTPEHLDIDLVHVRAYPTTEIELPVRVKTRGTLSKGVSFGELVPRPSTVSLIVRKQDVGRILSVPTMPVDLSGVQKDTETTVALDLPKHSRLVSGQSDEVVVAIEASSPSP